MTQIEKEAFLGNYIGCEIEWLRESDNTWITTILTASDFSFLVKKKCRLITKSIESITDEDAKLLGFKGAYDFIHYLSFGQQFLQEESDKLRELGYLVPFRQYSTEQLIESGIAKI